MIIYIHTNKYLIRDKPASMQTCAWKGGWVKALQVWCILSTDGLHFIRATAKSATKMPCWSMKSDRLGVIDNSITPDTPLFGFMWSVELHAWQWGSCECTPCGEVTGQLTVYLRWKGHLLPEVESAWLNRCFAMINSVHLKMHSLCMLDLVCVNWLCWTSSSNSLKVRPHVT